MTINGTISANGGNATTTSAVQNAPSGGSGGSIYITAATITGNGPMYANGGNGVNGGTRSGAGGGGGRISFYYQNSTYTGVATTSGGTHGTGGFVGGNGAAGTITTHAVTSVPGSPTSVEAVRGDAQATVSFTAPVSNGGAAITYYTAISNPDNITAYGASSPITVTGLTNGTSYTFTVKATNSVGTSSASTASSAIVPSAIPTVTSSSTVDSITQTSATLNGAVTVTGGVNATEHGFNYGTTTDLSAAVGTTTGGALSGAASFTASLARDISSLVCGTTYYFRAYAVNTAGTGYGSIQSFSTAACDVPAVPAAESAPAQHSVSYSGSSSSGFYSWLVLANPLIQRTPAPTAPSPSVVKEFVMVQ